MSYTIYLGSFAKHENSTKRPALEGWASFDVVFKDGANITTPEVTIAAELATVLNYNYAAMLGRYYWIREKNALRNGYIVLSLEVDVLATYKNEIGASSLYILRSSAASDGLIRDNYYPMTALKITDGQILESDDIGLSAGCYVVNILGSNTASSTLYLMTPATFTTFLRTLLAEVANITGLDFSQAAVNAIFEPLNYIKSVIWLPVSYQTAAAAFGATPGTGNIFAGLWDSGVTGSTLNTGATILNTYSITLPKHPQAAARGAYLNAAPFTEYVIDYEPFGVISLDASRLVDDTTLSINIYVDAITGGGILKAGGNNSGPVASVSAQYGVPIPLAGAASNFGAVASFLTGAANLGVGLITANPALIGIGAAAGIGSFGDAARGIISTTGASGSMAAYQTGKTFGAIFHYIVAEDNARNGRPLCQVTAPAALTGFMIAQKGDVDIAAPLPELERIRAFLETGFYFE